MNSHISKRPALKGVFHLITAWFHILIYPSLSRLIPSDCYWPLTLYLWSVIGHFGASALFHIIDWRALFHSIDSRVLLHFIDSPKHLIIYPRRLDHVMIFLNIAATYYAAIATVFHDISVYVKYTIVIGTILGIVIRIFYTDAPKKVIAIPYIILGWTIILDPYTIMHTMSIIPMGCFLAILAGLLYTIGACMYIMKWPRLCPTYMGYHEMFHILTIIGSLLFTICIFQYAIPYHVFRNTLS
jgi:hemolysin III